MSDLFLKINEAKELNYIPLTSAVYQSHYKPFTKRIKNEIYVNITQLERRKRFVAKVKYLAGCNYYIITEYWTDAQLARYLHKHLGGTYRGWYTFLNAGGLFTPILEEKNLNSTVVPNNLWNFYRATRCLIRSILRRWGKGSWEYNQLIKDLYESNKE